jgi:hypothetical protein
VNARRLFVRLGTLLIPLGLLLVSTHEAQAKPSPTDVEVGGNIEFINSWSQHVFKNRDRYAQWVADMKIGPTCRECSTVPSARREMTPRMTTNNVARPSARLPSSKLTRRLSRW